MAVEVFEATNVTTPIGKIVVIRVPQFVIDSPMKMGVVMARAAHDLSSRRVLLLSADTGRIVGNHDDKDAVAAFDPEKAHWRQWNMEE